MSKLPVLIKIELEKIIRKRSALWVALMILAIQTGAAFFEHSARLANDDLVSGFQVGVFSLKICLQLLAMIVLAFSAMSLSEEIATGTVKIILVRDVRRRDFILGKFIALLCLSTVFLVFCHFFSLVLGHFLGGLNAIAVDGFLLFSASELKTAFFGGMGLTLIAFIALIAFGCFISILVKGSGGAVASAMVIYFLMQILSQMNLFQKYLFTRYLFLPVDHMTRLVEGIYVDWSRYADWAIGVSSVSVLLFLVLSVVIFKRQDVWH